MGMGGDTTGYSGMFPQLIRSAGRGLAKPDLLKRDEGEESVELRIGSGKIVPVLRKFAERLLPPDQTRKD
jgi:hypothetical protein